MKVLSVIIATPLRKVTGATNAGRALSAATAELVDLDLAVMWDEDRVERAGRLTTRYVACRNLLGPLARFAPRSIRTPLYDSRIPQLVREGDYDLVHVHNMIPSFAALRLIRAAHRRGLPVVISTHGFVEIAQYAEINGFGRLRSALVALVVTAPFRRAVALATRLFALSDRESALLASLGFWPDRVDVVTNGVDERFLEPRPEPELSAGRALLPEGEEPVLLFFGSLHSYKGVATFLAALGHLGTDVRAVVAGGFNDPGLPQRLLDAAGLAPAVRDRVRFAGRVSDEQLRGLYAVADLFVYPTEGDTLPLVVLEAMASGLPVVSTLVGGVPFEVPPDCGVLVPPRDPGAVAAAVDGLLGDPARRARAGEAARARVEEVFRWQRSAQVAVDAYARVLQPPRPARRRNGEAGRPRGRSSAG